MPDNAVPTPEQPDELADPVEPVADAPAENPPPDDAPAPKRRRWGLIIGIAAALVLVVAIALPVFSMLQPGYYKRYSSLQKRMDNWSVSTHAKVSCYECHAEPGARGFLSFSAQAIPAFYSQMISGPSRSNLFASPSRQACQRCHTSFRQVSPNGDLLIPHKAHVEVLKMECPACHKDLVHSVNEQGFNRPEMEQCLSACHDGETASNECIDCHTQKQVPDNHRQKNWLAIHPALVNKVDCGQCHSWTDTNFCTECHEKKPASHKGNWKTTHAAAAKARGEKGCLVCHGGEKFCKQCHD